jgi:hypothetical protein
MPFLFMIIGVAIWIVIPDEITRPVDEAIQNGLKKAVNYFKKGPKKPYEE